MYMYLYIELDLFLRPNLCGSGGFASMEQTEGKCLQVSLCFKRYPIYIKMCMIPDVCRMIEVS